MPVDPLITACIPDYKQQMRDYLKLRIQKTNHEPFSLSTSFAMHRQFEEYRRRARYQLGGSSLICCSAVRQARPVRGFLWIATPQHLSAMIGRCLGAVVEGKSWMRRSVLAPLPDPGGLRGFSMQSIDCRSSLGSEAATGRLERCLGDDVPGCGAVPDRHVI